MRTLLVLLALAGGLVAAPAPTPRPKPATRPPSWVGTWDMLWRGGTYRTTFGPDGSYRCGPFAGTWCVTPDRVLHVEELSADGGLISWSVTLCGPRSGVTDDGADWSIEPPPGVDR